RAGIPPIRFSNLLKSMWPYFSNFSCRLCASCAVDSMSRAIRFAGLRVATLAARIYPSPFADRPGVITPARAGSKRKFMRVIQSLDQAQVPHARSRVHENFFRMLKDRPKNVGIIGVQRLPTAHPLSPERKFGTSI